MESLVTRQVTPNGAKKSIKRAFKKKRPLFLWGPPGIGKSDIIGQITNELGKSHLIDIRYGIRQILRACRITPNRIIR